MPITIRPTSSGSSKSGSSNSSTIELLFFIALNVLVIPYSGYQTFVGYENDVSGHWLGAAVIAAISAVLFAAMNFGIRQRRLEGKTHIWQVLLYVVPLGLSFFGNFNAFYSQQMQNELYDQEISRYEQVLTETHDNAVQILKESTGLEELRTSKDAELSSLQSQYDGRGGKGGWGAECERHWVNLKSTLESQDPLGSRITNFNPGLKDKMASARALANSYFNQLEENKEAQVLPFISFADAQFHQVDSLIKDSRKNKTLNQNGREILDGIIKANNQIGAKTHSHLKDFKYEPLETSAQNQIGTIKHTIKSAFIDMDSPSATFFSFFLSLIIDLSALFYILLFVPYRKTSGSFNRGPRVV